MTTGPVTVGALRAELVGWPDDAPVTVAVPDTREPSIQAVLPVVAAGFGPGIDAGDDPVLASVFPLTAVRHASPLDGDAWGVPASMFGPMPPEFYAGVGRVAALSALLEDRLRALLQAVRQVAQTKHAGDGASRLKSELRRRAQHLGPDWEGFEGFAERVDRVIERRNTYVHSLWQPKDGAFYGHRTDREDGSRESCTVSLADLRADVTELVALNVEWHAWFMLAGGRPPHRRGR